MYLNKAIGKYSTRCWELCFVYKKLVFHELGLLILQSKRLPGICSSGKE